MKKQSYPHQPLIDWLLKELEERNLSMSEASRNAGLYQGAISAIVSGTQPGLTACKRLAAYFGVPTEYVLRLAGHLPPEERHEEMTEQILFLAQKLTPELQQLYLEIGQTLIRFQEELAGSEELEGKKYHLSLVAEESESYRTD
ncbi:MAG: XRE family transcriptional regulator [Chloroflexi bacterium]|nr:MAG: XRE family transcriptional regulator [Chloroflexota bacterium]